MAMKVRLRTFVAMAAWIGLPLALHAQPLDKKTTEVPPEKEVARERRPDEPPRPEDRRPEDSRPGEPRGGDPRREGPRGEGPRGEGPDGRRPPPRPEHFDGEDRPRPGFPPPDSRPGSNFLPGRGPREGEGFWPGGRRGPHEGRPDDLQRTDPEMFELERQDQDLERQTEELAGRLRRAPESERADVKKQLQDLVEKHFDARQARRELQLKRLEAELERMRESMKKRLELREQIVGRRVSELAGERNELDF